MSIDIAVEHGPAAHALGLQPCESSDSLVGSLHELLSSPEPMLSQDWALDIMGLPGLLLSDSLSRLRCRRTAL